MSEERTPHPVILRVEGVILIVLQLILLCAVIIATAFACWIFLQRVFVHPSEIKTVDVLHLVLQNVFGGVLIVYLGLELLETLRLHFNKRDSRLRAIIAVAMIAVARQTVVIDPAETPASVLFGLAALLVALAVANFCVRRSAGDVDAEQPSNFLS
jgi:uncharacterized membrane protein (DUF373 family)